MVLAVYTADSGISGERWGGQQEINLRLCNIPRVCLSVCVCVYHVCPAEEMLSSCRAAALNTPAAPNAPDVSSLQQHRCLPDATTHTQSLITQHLFLFSASIPFSFLPSLNSPPSPSVRPGVCLSASSELWPLPVSALQRGTRFLWRPGGDEGQRSDDDGVKFSVSVPHRIESAGTGSGASQWNVYLALNKESSSECRKWPFCCFLRPRLHSRCCWWSTAASFCGCETCKHTNGAVSVTLVLKLFTCFWVAGAVVGNKKQIVLKT